MRNFAPFYLLILYLFFSQTLALPRRDIINITAQEKLIKTNTKIELLEQAIRERNHKEVCIQSSALVNLINKHFSELKKLEPQHNWKEIKEAIHQISLRSCKR